MMAVSKALRYEIMRRDNATCRYCGATAPGVKLTIDHVTPVTLGGTDLPSNLVVACVDCNAGKSATPPGAPLVEDVKQEDLRWKRAIDAAAATYSISTEERNRLNLEFQDLWVDHMSNTMREFYRPADWTRSLDTFRSHGLSQVEIKDAFWRAYEKRAGYYDTWKYFCGICWSKIREIHDAARAFLAVEDADGP